MTEHDGTGLDRSAAARRFYEARDRRTLQYGATESGLEVPITIRIDQSALAHAAGRSAGRAVVDMVMRVHRQVTIEVVGGSAEAADLADALRHQAAAIDPFQDVTANWTAVSQPGLIVDVTLEPARSSADIIATWTGGRGEVWIEHLAPEGTFRGDQQADDEQLLGAAAAACLAAAALFRVAHGDTVHSTAVNVLECTEGGAASLASISGPIDIGAVDVIGGGAVAHGLAYWAREFGVSGEWTFIDRDNAELHNTNRCLGMTVADAGWPDGEPGTAPATKASVAAALIGAAWKPRWFHELPEDRVRPDLVLVLANEHGVRAQAASLGESLLLQATTSPNWTAELHRHLASADDDCPACRIPEQSKPTFTCSTGSSRPGSDDSPDAALPFLSAMAGLLLAVTLLDLPGSRRVLTGELNHWRLHMELGPYVWQRLSQVKGSCPHLLSTDVRRAAQSGQPRRWDLLEQQGEGHRDPSGSTSA